MLTGGTILDLLPWVIFAPALPLLLILITKAYGNGRQMSLVLLCVITILSNLFLILAARSTLQASFLKVSFIADFIFTLLLLKNCTDHRILKYSIFSILLVFLGIYISYHFFISEGEGLPDLMFAGVNIVFIMAVLVLSSQIGRVDRNIITSPDFWYSGGVFFHFGLLSLLLFTGRKITDVNYHEKDDLTLLYTIIFCMQFIFFTIGVYYHKPWLKKSTGLF